MIEIVHRKDGWKRTYETGDKALNGPLFMAFVTGLVQPEGYDWIEDGTVYSMVKVVESARTLSRIYDISKQYAAHVS